jgi:hypothetical protein
MPEVDAPPTAREETKPVCVSSDRAAADHISPQPAQSLEDLVREAIDCYGAHVGRVLHYIADNGGGRSWPEPRIRRVYAWVLKTRRWSRRDAREAAKARTLSAAALKRVSRSLASQAATYAQAGDKRAPVWMRLAGIYADEEARRAPPQEPILHELWVQVDPVAYAQARPRQQTLHRGPVPVARAALVRHTEVPQYDGPAMIARLKARRREAG